MKAIIVAGGKGERLLPLTKKIPKPLVEIGGKPILQHIIEQFKNHNITEFIVTVCYLSEKITKYFENGKKFDVTVDYIYEDQGSPLGTAGGLAKAKELINDTFFVTYSDVIRKVNFAEMLEFHKKKNALATIGIYKRVGESPKSDIKFDSDNRIVSYIERPQTQNHSEDFVWSNAAIYIFEPEVFSFINPNTPQDFGKDIFPRILKNKRKLYAYPIDDFFIDIGDPTKLTKARKIHSYLEK